MARLDSKVFKLAHSILEFKRRDFPGTRTSSHKALVSLLRHRLDWKSWTGLHDGHQRIVKCSRRTKEPVSWPGLGKQLVEMVTNCHKCFEHRKPNRESVISSAVPERPWQVLETDLFSLNGRTYLLMLDYFSRFIEISLLLASQKVKRYAHQSPYSPDTEYPIYSILIIGHNSSQRDSTSSQRITRSHMWRQSKSCRKAMARRSEPYTDKEYIKERKRPS